MKSKRLYLIACILFTSVAASAQNATIENFNKKIKMAQLILEKQPTAKDIKGILTDGFTLDSTNTTGYYIKYTDNTQIVGYLYKDSEKSVYVSFYENNDLRKEIYDYTEKEMKYIYIASEHMCDYYNNGSYGLCFCPNMKEGLLVHVEKMNK